MNWYKAKIPFNSNTIQFINNILITFSNSFQKAYITDELAIFYTSFEEAKKSKMLYIYFTPKAAENFNDLILKTGAIECEVPKISELEKLGCYGSLEVIESFKPFSFD